MQDEIYKIIDKLENNDLIKELKDLKKKILSSDEALSLIKRFNESKENLEKYNLKDDFIKNKKELMENKLIKRYLELQNEVKMLAMYINDKINSITSIGGKNEGNKW